ncbi:hypothetical protein [Methylobacterium sp. CM6257]
MAFTEAQQAALNRLLNFYEGLKAYNAATNPGGLRQGGHLINFVPALQDLATVVNAVAPMVDAAQAASAASPKALRADNAQSFVTAEIVTLLTNIGLLANNLPLTDAQKTKILSNLGAAAILAAAVQKTGDTMTGKLTMSSAPIEVSGTNPYIDLTYGGVLRARVQVDGSGNIIFRNGDNNDNFFYVAPSGAFWTKQLGDLNSRIESRGSAWADNAVNRCVTSTRLSYVADENVAAQFGGGMREVYGASMVTGRTTNLANDQQDIIVTVLRYRQLQQYIPNQGWVASYFA